MLARSPAIKATFITKALSFFTWIAQFGFLVLSLIFAWGAGNMHVSSRVSSICFRQTANASHGRYIASITPFTLLTLATISIWPIPVR